MPTRQAACIAGYALAVGGGTVRRSLTYSAESICRDLGFGKDESELRRVMASVEILGDPSLDKDIPVYVDAIFEAAKTYVCP